MFCYGFAAPALHALGQTGAALEALQKAHQFANQTTLSDVSWVLALEANFHLQLGDLLPAIRWAETAGLSPGDEPQYLYMEQHLVYARLLVAQARHSDARRWLARLERFADDRALYRWLLAVHLLQALVAIRSGDHATAVERLGRALEIAAPGDYYRAFLDEDEQLLDPLSDLHYLAPDFVDQLLAYAGRAQADTDVTSKFPAAQPLVASPSVSASTRFCASSPQA
jgi:tetratricopeptide (TPR) repeat protein